MTGRAWAKGLLKALRVAWLFIVWPGRILWFAYQLVLGAVFLLLLIAAARLLEYSRILEIRALRHENPHSTAFIREEAARLQIDPTLSGSGARDSGGVMWKWVGRGDIPPMVRDMVVVAEDGRFYQHKGFDLEQIEYAVVANHQQGARARGASTITQQVAKNLFLGGEKTYARKLREAVMTVLLEHYLSKERILEIYLNIAQFGPGVFGIGTAARHYYGKDLRELTFGQVVDLAACLPLPEKWNPVRRTAAYERHRRRVAQNLVLYRGIRQRIPDDAYLALQEYSQQEAKRRWQALRDRAPSPWDEMTQADTARTGIFEHRD